jgi:hypothetical protein
MSQYPRQAVRANELPTWAGVQLRTLFLGLSTIHCSMLPMYRTSTPTTARLKAARDTPMHNEMTVSTIMSRDKDNVGIVIVNTGSIVAGC